jgi:hypothetical protein
MTPVTFGTVGAGVGAGVGGVGTGVGAGVGAGVLHSSHALQSIPLHFQPNSLPSLQPTVGFL